MAAAVSFDFEAAVLGGSLPLLAEQALREASQCRSEPAAELAALMRAQTEAPDHPAVLIALYRYHFYAQRLQPARAVVRRALALTALALGLPEVWRDVPARALAGARDDPVARFYLFSLKGLAYLSLRLGDAADARDALTLLRALDPDDHVGGALLEGIRQRALAGEDDAAQQPTPAVFGAAAWARLVPAP